MMNKPNSLGARPALQSAPFLRAGGVWPLGWLAAGYLFTDCFFSASSRFSAPARLALFAPLYAALVLAALRACGRRPARESWLWLAAMLLTAAAQCLPWAPDVLGPWHFLGLLALAAYWTACACSALAAGGKTSQWAPADLFWALCVYPFGNFGRLAAHLAGAAARRVRRKRAGKRADRAALAGWLAALCLTALLLAFVLPSLAAADDRFAALCAQLLRAPFSLNTAWLGEWIARTLFSLPVAAYLYGLFAGAATGRHRLRDKSIVCAVHAAALRLSRGALMLPAAALGAVYAVFLALQADTLLGGLAGVLPAGFTYAGYARQGFFDLLFVAAVTGAFLAFAWYAARGRMAGARRALCTALTGLTLLLCVTAAAKLWLYVAALGLTPRRTLAGAALVWLFFAFFALLCKMWCAAARRFSLPRAGVFFALALFLVLAAAPFPLAQGV